MKNLSVRLRMIVSLLVISLLVVAVGCGKQGHNQTSASAKLIKVRYGISPFQDTLLPIIGSDKYKGWYKQEGLDVQFSILGWTEVQEALAGNQIDVAINNISSVVATHHKRPQFVYWYGLNTFDNGFALMIRPNGKFKTVEQIEEKLHNHNQAVIAAAKQLKSMTVVTTGNTDMEQGVAAAARRGGLDFRRDVHIINMNPDEGLAAFLAGTGDAYIGGIPQRTRASKEGMVEMLSGIDLGPAPINGIVTTGKYAKDHQEVLLKLLKVWFKIVNDVERNPDANGKIIVDILNQNSGASFTLSDFKKFWQHYEHYPLTPAEVDRIILNPSGRNYWKARWDDCNNYFYNVAKVIPEPVKPEDAFMMLQAHKAYVAKYGKGIPN